MKIQIVTAFWESNLAVTIKNKYSLKQNSRSWNLSHTNKNTAYKDIRARMFIAACLYGNKVERKCLLIIGE